MPTYLRQITNTLSRLLIILVLYSLCRGLFYALNQAAFSGASPDELVKVFLYAIRFDFSAIILFNLPFLAAFLLPFNFVHNRHYRRAADVSFIIINATLLLINLCDTEYFKYTGKRSTADLFHFIFMSDDVATLLPQFIHDFWYIGLVWGVFITTGLFVYTRFFHRHVERYAFSLKLHCMVLLLFLLVCGVLFLGARGMGVKPIRIITAGRYAATQNIPLLLNTPFCILHTFKTEHYSAKRYFDEGTLSRLYDPEQRFPAAGIHRTDNVVVIILESFSKEFIGALNNGKGYTPCLDRIIRDSLVFENAFANGKTSMHALPALFAGIPGLMDEPYISSQYSGNSIMAMPAILSAEGYHTSFFHGGRNGTMGFDDFSHIAGIKHYYGLNEYQGPAAFDGKWGIYDEEFLQFYAETLKTFPEPFFSSVFTLSSHHPYNVPERHKKKFSSAPNPLLQSIGYTDYALGRFFQTISTAPWYKHTLFVLVADHTAVGQSLEYSTRAGMYRIPLIFFHPGDSNMKGSRQRVTQQTDIMPSLLDYLGVKRPFTAFGSSVFDSANQGFAVNYLGGVYQYFRNDFMLSFDGEKSMALYQISRDPLLQHNLLNESVSPAAAMERQLKAIIQQYDSRMLNNRLVHSAPAEIHP
ncbi:MAG: sulfatase-like hydrolase/transferase [Desulfuromonadales bacterium]|nr:sulfatase-like hydrolase/transferase [Desulfuromonadales bacterium]